MSLADEQAAFLRLTTSVTDQDEFFRDPEEVGQRWGLAPDVVAQLRAREAEIRRFGRSLRNKRRGEVGHLVPRLKQALGGEFEAWFARYCRESPGAGQRARDEEAQAFARFVAALADIPAAHYDAAALETRHTRKRIVICRRPFAVWIRWHGDAWWHWRR